MNHTLWATKMTSSPLKQLAQSHGGKPFGALSQGYILVVGCGVTGRSCVRWLNQYETPVVVADSRRELAQIGAVWQSEFAHINIVYGNFSTPLFTRAKMIVLSPGVSMREPSIVAALACNVPVISDIELFLQHAEAPIIAITGTNGKSTVTTLVTQMLRQQGLHVKAGANLGTPALELLPPLELAPQRGEENAVSVATVDYYVLELSSFQLEATHSLRTDSAVVLNLGNDHADRYPDDPLAYGQAKAKVYRNCRAPVINCDDFAAFSLYQQDSLRHTKQACTYSLRKEVACDFGVATDRAGNGWVVHRQQPVLPLSSIQLVGRHNLSNVLAACALSYQASCAYPAIARAVAAYSGLAHRCELVLENHQVRWVNDSKGTNVDATVAAIESVGALSPIILIAGGDAKGADLSPLRASLKRYVRQLILYGRDALQMEVELGAVTTITQVADLKAAVAWAIAVSRVGDTVLFSPACASFDMFSDYAERGAYFKRLLRKALGV